MPISIVNFEAIQTGDGSLTLKHPIHGEAYHSFAGASTEAKDLYVMSSGLMECLVVEGLSGAVEVLDVGLGLGYNALCTIDAWVTDERVCRDLCLTSLEHDADLILNLISGEALWQQNWSQRWRDVARMVTHKNETEWHAELIHPVSGAKLYWRIFRVELCDEAVPASAGAAGYSFVWQDPFSPKINPALWSVAWFARVRERCAPDAVLMTYSVARPVKDGLQQSGWGFKLIPTTTSKRAWLKAVVV